jgi:nitronate monooxygenase
MPIPAALTKGLKLPAIASPMFLASGPDLVVETARAGVIGTFPALNQRTTQGYGDWLDEIAGRLAETGEAAPFGVNLIVHRSNARIEADVMMTVAKKVPLVITSLGAVKDVVDAVHSYGGLVFHDVINARHAEKAAEAGVDGIIAVAAGAGGHAGSFSPFALVSEIRKVWSGTLVLAGAMNTGADILAARAMGADMGYMGTRFLATREAQIEPAYKDMIVGASARDILYTPAISGVNANFLKPSIIAAGLDPDNLASHGKMDLEGEAKAWKTVWSAGHGVGGISEVLPAGELCARLIAEYKEAKAAVAADPF